MTPAIEKPTYGEIVEMLSKMISYVERGSYSSGPSDYERAKILLARARVRAQLPDEAWDVDEHGDWAPDDGYGDDPVQLRRLLASRDNFLVSRGIFADYADTLPQKGVATSPTSTVEPRGTAWRDMESVPTDGTKVILFTAGRCVVKAFLDENGAEGKDGPCDVWKAAEEGQHPYCWTDGLCWDRNADDEPSDPPILWMPLPAAPDPTPPDQGAREQGEGA